MIENTDYELIPGEDDIWNVRILTGDYIETVFSFGKLKVVGEELHFTYDLEYSPIEELEESDLDLQETVKAVLVSVLESAVGNQQG